MANRIFIIPLRNDLDGMGVQVTDLWPNTSQRNGVLDGPGQTCYIGACPDAPGTTQVSGATYVRGSKSTTLAANPVADDTTGGGDDVVAPVTTTLGLAAYIRERVENAGGGDFIALADANTMAASIRTAALAGDSLTEPAISALLDAVVGGTGLIAGYSFGTVEDILRILSGETYISPQYTIIGDQTNAFLGETDRDVLVAAQLVGLNGGITFRSKGHFLTSLETGYVGRPTIAKTGIALASLGVGQLQGFSSSTQILVNPAFVYGTGGTAVNIVGAAIPVTTPLYVTPPTILGQHAFLNAYDQDGTRL